MSTDNKDMKNVRQTESSDAVSTCRSKAAPNSPPPTETIARPLPRRGGSTVSSNATIHSFWAAWEASAVGTISTPSGGKFMNLRLQPAVEAEGLYIGMDDSHASGSFGGNTQFSTNSGDFFITASIRLKNSSRVTPYFGIGAGLQYITTHGQLSTPAGTATGLDTSDHDFAAQALAGFDVAIADHLSVFTEYKFIDAIGTDGKSDDIGGGSTYRLKPDQLQQHLIMAGVKYSF